MMNEYSDAFESFLEEWKDAIGPGVDKALLAQAFLAGAAAAIAVHTWSDMEKLPKASDLLTDD